MLLLALGCLAPPPVAPAARFTDAGVQLTDGPRFGVVVPGARREVDGPEVRYVAPGITEWWRPLSTGFEVGWIVDTPAPEVVLEVPIAGGQTSDAPGAVWVDTPTRRYRYARLYAHDAADTPLDAHLAATGAGIRVRVDTRAARFPITIDPIVTVASETVSPATPTGFGQAVSIGDVDADGYDDLAASTISSGQVYVYRGTAAGLAAFAVASGNGDDFGYAVDLRGDLDGDGYHDLVVGNPASSGAAVYAFPGGTSGLGAATSVSASSSGSEYGRAVSTGDVDGDGYDDVAVGSTNYAGTEGHVWLYLGGARGLSTTRETELNAPGSPSGFGSVVDAHGDLDGDGYHDVVASAPLYDDGGTVGYVRIGYGRSGPWESEDGFGGESGSGFAKGAAVAGDLDGDGYDDLVVGASTLAEARWFPGAGGGVAHTESATISEAVSTNYATRVAAAGDVDADGYDDLLVARPGDTALTGQLWVYGGGASGPGTTAIATVSDAAGTTFANAMAGGDLNADGYADVAVGAPGTGAVTVYYGYADVDGDGAWATEDCDDTDPARHPGAAEVCDAVDQDCDGLTDEGVAGTSYPDADDDGYGSPDGAISECTPPSGYVGNGDDCDDDDADVHPGMDEVAGDGVDGDCDGAELCFVDADEDGARSADTTKSEDPTCAEPGQAGAAAAIDCDDTDADVFPGAPDAAGDGVDTDCDGVEACYQDADGDGYRTDAPVPGEDLDCDDPGEVPETVPGGDCDDTRADVSPVAIEVAGDEVDGDCDGTETCLVDADGDGWRALGLTVVASPDPDCGDPGEAAATTPGGDCDDADPGVHPTAPDPEDGVDQDCDGADGAPDPEDSGKPAGTTPDCGCAHGLPSLSGAGILLALSLSHARSRAGRGRAPRRPRVPAR